MRDEGARLVEILRITGGHGAPQKLHHDDTNVTRKGVFFSVFFVPSW